MHLQRLARSRQPCQRCVSACLHLLLPFALGRYATGVLNGARARGEGLSVASRSTALSATSWLALSQSATYGGSPAAFASFVADYATPVLHATALVAASGLQLGEAPLVRPLVLFLLFLLRTTQAAVGCCKLPLGIQALGCRSMCFVMSRCR